MNDDVIKVWLQFQFPFSSMAPEELLIYAASAYRAPPVGPGMEMLP